MQEHCLKLVIHFTFITHKWTTIQRYIISVTGSGVKHVINKHRKESFPNKPAFNLGFEFLTAKVTKIYIFCNISPCRQLRVDRRFRGTCKFHLQDQGRNQHEAGSKQRSASADFDFNSSIILCSVLLDVGNPNLSQKKIQRYKESAAWYYWNRLGERTTNVHPAHLQGTVSLYSSYC
jgi:hypothetical protein